MQNCKEDSDAAADGFGVALLGNSTVPALFAFSYWYQYQEITIWKVERVVV